MSGKWISAGGIVLKQVDGVEHVFVIHPTGSGYGSWQLPKGRVDLGESRVQAAIREVKEEVGVVAKLLRSEDDSYIGAYTGEYSITHFYLMRYVSGSPKKNEEVSEIRLLSFDDAMALFRKVGNKLGLQVLTNAREALAKTGAVL